MVGDADRESTRVIGSIATSKAVASPTKAIDAAMNEPVASTALLEANLAKLSALEEEWQEFGPIKTITFRCRCTAPELTESFATQIANSGFVVEQGSSDDGDIIDASVTLQPTAQKITALEELLHSFCDYNDEGSGCYVDDWNYPAKSRVTFRDHNHNDRAVRMRAAALFEKYPVHDPLLFTGWGAKGRKNFEIVPSDFLRRARMLRPKDPKPTASAFSQWVYSIYASSSGTEEDRAEGKAAEQEIWDRRRQAAGANDNRFLRNAGFDWTLIHNGLELRDRSTSTHFEILDLIVNGEPLRASPDLIYANGDRSSFLVVEIKHSRQELPLNLWPNIWAQLWCYSKIDAVRNANSVTVVGEVWGEEWSRAWGGRRNYHPATASICLRALVRRDPRSPAYDRFFGSLFQIYAGGR